MAFPRKFRHLVETRPGDVESPDYLWLAYAVCAVETASCGWGGWMIEAAFKRTSERHTTATGDRPLPALDEQVCPRCGRPTYRTGVTLRVEPSADQTPPRREGADYDARPLEFED